MTDRRFWDAFVESYVAREGFWHVPKQAISPTTEKQLREKLRILRTFEGKLWQSNQRRYATILRKRGLSTTRQAPSAFARVQKAVFDILGFAWVGSDGRVTITPAGRKFLSGQPLEKMIRKQLCKYQLWNPAAVAKFKDFRILPHVFLIQVLLRFQTRGVSRDEYLLFVCRATAHEDLRAVVEMIRKYRKLGPHERENLRKKVEAKKAKKGRSPYRAALLDFGYAVGFLAYPAYLTKQDDRIRIASGLFQEAKKIVRTFEKSGTHINFRNEAEWFAFYGDPNKKNSVSTAFSYYRDISDVGSLVELLELPRARKLLGESVKRGAIRESIVEDYLEHQPDELESGLVRVDRQFPTTVGTIDLLARDRKGGYVVIELKRGRTSDRVFGQILRYMGWVKENLRAKKPVRGIIVAEKVDRGLKYAMKVAKNAQIGLKRYDFNIQFWDAS